MCVMNDLVSTARRAKGSAVLRAKINELEEV